MDWVSIYKKDGKEEAVPVQVSNGRVRLRDIRNYVDDRATGLKALRAQRWIGVAIHDDAFQVEEGTKYRVHFLDQDSMERSDKQLKCVEDEATRKARILRKELDQKNKNSARVKVNTTMDRKCRVVKEGKKKRELEIQWYHRNHGGEDYERIYCEKELIIELEQCRDYSVDEFKELAVKEIKKSVTSELSEKFSNVNIQLATRRLAIIEVFLTTQMEPGFCNYIEERGAGGHRVGFKILTTTKLNCGAGQLVQRGIGSKKIVYDSAARGKLIAKKERQESVEILIESELNLVQASKEKGVDSQRVPFGNLTNCSKMKVDRPKKTGSLRKKISVNKLNIFGNSRFPISSNDSTHVDGIVEGNIPPRARSVYAVLNKKVIAPFDSAAIPNLPVAFAEHPLNSGIDQLLTGKIKDKPTAQKIPPCIEEEILECPEQIQKGSIIVPLANERMPVSKKKEIPANNPKIDIEPNIMKILALECPLFDMIPINCLMFEEKLKDGSHALVHKATYTTGSYHVAVKKIKPELRCARQMTVAEARTMVGLNHPNVVELVGVTKDYEEDLRIVMEYVPGLNVEEILLNEEIREKIEFSEMDEFRAALELMKAIAYLHDPFINVIHNNIYPGNLIFDPKTRSIKLCGFSLAQISKQTARGGSLMQEMERRSNLCYIAPEVYMLDEPSSKKSDVYSGCCTIVVIFGKKTVWPIEGVDDIEALINYKFMNREVPGTVGVPVSVRESVEKGLRFSPKERITADEVLSHFIEVTRHIHL